jgi:hypothetical protein
MTYIRRPEIVEAVQWNKVGDHDDITAMSLANKEKDAKCDICGLLFQDHGMRTLNALMQDTICPGMWIVDTENGLQYVNDKIFLERYELVKL